MIIPPIKSQGIKIKLVNWINEICNTTESSGWVEPFMGTGAVGFNISLSPILMSDSNYHIINFYNLLKNGIISDLTVRKYLEIEGKKLSDNGQEHYYKIRKRFNNFGDPYDFIFLNNSCFNGLIRFNSKGYFNTPFCRKPERFSKLLITKICNQIKNTYNKINESNCSFIHSDFRKTIENANNRSIIYYDPPYINRNSTYYNSWNHHDEIDLCNLLKQKKINL